MKEWFSGIVRGKTTDSRGKDKKVRHLFIVDATGFTEAENVLVADKFPVYKEPKVISLKREAIEAVYDECDTESAVWWKVVIGLEWLDVKGRTKVSKCTYMVSSETAGDVKGRDKQVYAGERERLEDIENRGYAGKGNHSPQGEA